MSFAPVDGEFLVSFDDLSGASPSFILTNRRLLVRVRRPADYRSFTLPEIAHTADKGWWTKNLTVTTASGEKHLFKGLDAAPNNEILELALTSNLASAEGQVAAGHTTPAVRESERARTPVNQDSGKAEIDLQQASGHLATPVRRGSEQVKSGPPVVRGTAALLRGDQAVWPAYCVGCCTPAVDEEPLEVSHRRSAGLFSMPAPNSPISTTFTWKVPVCRRCRDCAERHLGPFSALGAAMDVGMSGVFWAPGLFFTFGEHPQNLVPIGLVLLAIGVGMAISMIVSDLRKDKEWRQLDGPAFLGSGGLVSFEIVGLDAQGQPTFDDDTAREYPSLFVFANADYAHLFAQSNRTRIIEPVPEDLLPRAEQTTET